MRPLHLVWIAACLCLIASLAGCSQSETTSSKEAPNESEALSSSASNSSAEANATDESIFIGSWEIIQITLSGKDSDKDSEEEVGPADIVATYREKGVDNCVVFNPDGSAVLMLWGVYFYGTWEIDDEFEEKGLGTVALAKFNAPAGDTLQYAVFIEDSQLFMTYEDYLVECKKAKDKEPLTKDEHDAAMETFVGTWYLTSTTRNGETHTVESSQLSSDAMLVFKNDMKVTLSYEDESVETIWGITGIDSGYIDSPVEGYALSISDGVLTVSESDSVFSTYVKG